MRTTRTYWFAAMVAAVVTTAACATKPAELEQAHDAYQEAATDHTHKDAPAELREAREALSRAEKAWQEEGNTAKTRALSYVAIRKAKLAMAQADVQQLQERKVALEQKLMEETDQARKSAQKQLEESRRQQQGTLEALRDKRRQLEQARLKLEQQRESGELRAEAFEQRHQQLAQQIEELEERIEGRAAESTRQQGMMEKFRDLEDIAMLEDVERGIVVRMDAGTLFTGTESTALSMQGKTHLDRVAKVLGAHAVKSVRVEAHAGGELPKKQARDITRQRARAVRDYLSTQGVDKDRIEAAGKGGSEPLGEGQDGDDDRIELVVEPMEQPKKQD